MTDHKSSIEKKLDKHPRLKKRIEQLLKSWKMRMVISRRLMMQSKRLLKSCARWETRYFMTRASNREKQEFERILNDKNGLVGNGKKK